MATTTRRDVELRINANDLSTKSLEQLVDTFDRLKSAQAEFAKSGDASQRSIRELQQDLKDLQAIALEIKGRASLVDQFEGLQAKAAEAAQRVENARAALAKFNASQKDGAELTKKQQAEFTKLTTAVTKAETSLAGATARVDKFNAKLAEIGAGSSTATRDALVKFSTDLGVSLEAAEQSIRRYDQALRDKQKAERDAADETRRLTKSVEEFEKANSGLANLTGFRAQGASALQSAAAIDALTRNYDELAVSSRKAGDSIRDILDPTRAALGGLEGLEQQVKTLNEELERAKSSEPLREQIRKLRAEYVSLAGDAGKAASSLADDIGRYRLAEQALGTLRTRVEQAQRSVVEFGAEMATAAAPSEELAGSLKQAQATLAGLVTQFERESQALANMRLRLREAGVDANNLAAAETRLRNVAAGVTEAQERLGAAVVRVGDSAERAGRGFDLFEDKGRKTLSTTQRLRGEVLSLVSSFGGLFAAIQVAGSTIEAAVAREGTLRQLELIEGGVDAAGVKFQQLRRLADDIGIAFETASEGFAKIGVGAKGAGVSAQRLDAFYLNLTKSIRGMSLSGEQAKRVFNAVSQTFDKNVLTAEEFKSQLGDAGLSGLATAAAEALNLSGEEFTKFMAEGRLGINSLIAIFDNYAHMIGGLSKQNNSVVDSLARFQSAVTDLKLALADAGFLQAFVDLLKDITQRVKAGEFKGAVEGLATAFRLVVEVARVLLDNLELVLAALALFAGNVAIKTVIELGGGLKTLAGAFAFLKKPVTAIALALPGVGKALAAVGVSAGAAAGGLRLFVSAVLGLTGVGLALWLKDAYESSEKVREVVILVVAAFVELGEALGELLTFRFAAFASNIEARLRRLQGQAAITNAVLRGESPDEGGPSTPAQRRSSGVVRDEVIAQDPGLQRLENQRLAQAEITAKTVADIEKEVGKARVKANQETAQSIGDILTETKAEFQETYDKIAALAKRGQDTADQATIAAAAKQREALDAEVNRIVAAKRKQQGDKFSRKERGEQQAELERARQIAERAKDALSGLLGDFDQLYQEGLVSLRDYFAGRRDITIAGLDAEIEAARAQIAILQKDAAQDPSAAKKIEALQGDISGAQAAKIRAESQFAFEVRQGTKALREQLAALQAELDALKGDDQQAGLRQIQATYLQQLDTVNKLEGAERDRAKAILDSVTAAKVQLLAIEAMRRASEKRTSLTDAAIDTADDQGLLTERQLLEALSERNRNLLTDLNEQKEALEALGDTGSDAYTQIQEAIVRTSGQVDLLSSHVRKNVIGPAVAGAVDEFFSVDEEGLDRLQSAQQALVEFNRQQEIGVALTQQQQAEYARLQAEVEAASGALESRTERALKSFGKSIAKSLAQSWADEISKAITKALAESVVGTFVKNLFGNLFGGITSFLGGKAHGGAIVGHGGMTPRRVSPLAFLGAPRYHSGGLPGLRRDERAVIVQTGEEILSRNSPRNALNQKAGGSAPSAAGIRLEVHPDALHMTLRDWFEHELARTNASY